MNMREIVKEKIDSLDSVDGLCNNDIGCGCGADNDLAPCEYGFQPDCKLAKSRTLNPDEYVGEGCPGDLYYFEA